MEKLEPLIELANSGEFPKQLDIGDLTDFLNISFGTRNMELHSEYFNINSPQHPKNLSFLVSVMGQNDFYMGILIAEEKEYEGFSFNYYDKIAVHPDFENNGIMSNLIKSARLMGNKSYDVQPSILRTSDLEISQKYAKLSDKHGVFGDYYVHGFGFFDKETGNPLIENAQEKFHLIAEYVAALPETFIKKPTQVTY